MIDRLLGMESHDERKDEVKSIARQRFWRMVIVSALFLVFALASASSDEPSTTSRLIDICRMF